MANTKSKTRQKQATKRTQRYRALYSKAKKMGLVKGDKDARKLKPSSYMKTKLNKLDPYLQGGYKAVKIPNRKIYREYSRTPTASTPMAANQRVLVRDEPGAVARVRKSVVRIIRKLEWGEFERVPIPFNINSINDLQSLEHNSVRLAVIDALKDELEYFFFMFYGNRSRRGFGDMQGLLDYFLQYDAFDKMTDDENLKHYNNFELYRAKGHVPVARYKNPMRRAGGRSRPYRKMNEFQREAKLEKQARYWEKYPERYEEHKKRMRQLQREKRATETPIQRAQRLEEQAKRQRLYREKRKQASGE